MKRDWILAILGVFALAVLGGCAGMLYTQPADAYPPPSPGNLDVSYFYDALAPYGDWLWSDPYGWVWCPSGLPVDWRPYTDGQWIWTDDGWTWDSDLDWGWGPFHYGRWYDDDINGWCWVPGQEWGPAWVAWREGGGWVGWAPLPPELRWHEGSGFDWNDWDHLPGVRHHWWSFCRESQLPGPEIQHRLAMRPRAVSLMKDTRNITHYAWMNSRVINRSLDINPVRQAYGHDIRAYHVDELSSPPDRHGRQLGRDAFYAYRPRLGEAPPNRAPRLTRGERPLPRQTVARAPSLPVPLTAQAARNAQDRQRREAIDLQRRQAAERGRLEQQQRRESNRPPAGMNAEQLRQQHEAEQRAFQEQAARDQRVLEARQMQEQRQRSEQRGPVFSGPPVRREQSGGRARGGRDGRGR